MRLIEKNIRHVIRSEMDGVTYSYFVAMKSGWVSDSRDFINYENGRTVVKLYKFEWLPAAVRKFVQKHEKKLLYELEDKDGKVFRKYWYKEEA